MFRHLLLIQRIHWPASKLLSEMVQMGLKVVRWFPMGLLCEGIDVEAFLYPQMCMCRLMTS